MVELFESDIREEERHSSKGNQLKWFDGQYWYKADYMGYEGLAEYVVSALLKTSTLDTDEYIIYDTERIGYKSRVFNGCRSRNFLSDGWQIITLERLFNNYYSQSFTKSIYRIPETEERMRFLVEQVTRITRLDGFGIYMSKLMAVDALFLNEDRHLHNIAVLLDDKGMYHYCPIFDNGSTLLSDSMMDYPMGSDIMHDIERVKAKTVCGSFDEQLEAAERLYGQQIRFGFARGQVEKVLDMEMFYGDAQKQRVKEVILQQMRKYPYLF